MRRSVIPCTGLAMLALLGACQCAPTVDRNTTLGVVRGTIVDESVEAYRGIRYGAPPEGLARFQPATAPAASAEIVEATAFGPACAQRDFLGFFQGADDCLRVNVWTPAGAAVGDARPVLVFIHGGGNSFGSSSENVAGREVYDGQAWPRDEGVVLVTLNYRLGPFGFFSHEAVGGAKNLGLRDQISALTWVRDHIESFGGDPAQVTIFGESGGGVDACALLASPLAVGLFRRAVVQSGSCVLPPLSVRSDSSARVVEALGCSADPGPCLAAASSRDIAFALDDDFASDIAAGLNPWGPAVDGEVLPVSPHLAVVNEGFAPFVIGTNARENAFRFDELDTCDEYAAEVEAQFAGQTATASEVLAQYPCTAFASPALAWEALLDDVRFHCPSLLVARAAAERGDPVARYLWQKGRERGIAVNDGAFHGVELLFQFDTLGSSTEAERAVGREARRRWAAFARAEDPFADPVATADAFVPFTTAREAITILDEVVTVEEGLHDAACDFWEGRLPLQ